MPEASGKCSQGSWVWTLPPTGWAEAHGTGRGGGWQGSEHPKAHGATTLKAGRIFQMTEVGCRGIQSLRVSDNVRIRNRVRGSVAPVSVLASAPRLRASSAEEVGDTGRLHMDSLEGTSQTPKWFSSHAGH